MWKVIEPYFVWVLRVCLALWCLYVVIVKPHVNPVATERADSISHVDPKICFGGCANFNIPKSK